MPSPTNQIGSCSNASVSPCLVLIGSLAYISTWTSLARLRILTRLLLPSHSAHPVLIITTFHLTEEFGHFETRYCQSRSILSPGLPRLLNLKPPKRGCERRYKTGAIIHGLREQETPLSQTTTPISSFVIGGGFDSSRLPASPRLDFRTAQEAHKPFGHMVE